MQPGRQRPRLMPGSPQRGCERRQRLGNGLRLGRHGTLHQHRSLVIDDAHRRLFDRHIQSRKMSHRRYLPSPRRPGIGADGHLFTVQTRLEGEFRGRQCVMPDYTGIPWSGPLLPTSANPKPAICPSSVRWSARPIIATPSHSPSGRTGLWNSGRAPKDRRRDGRPGNDPAAL